MAGAGDFMYESVRFHAFGVISNELHFRGCRDRLLHRPAVSQCEPTRPVGEGRVLTRERVAALAFLEQLRDCKLG